MNPSPFIRSRALFSVALALVSGPVTLAEEAETTAYLTLQVRDESSYNARDVWSFLSDPAFLGSIAANLVPEQPAPKGDLPAGMVVVGANLVGNEIVSLTARGERAATDVAIARIHQTLESIVPSGRAAADEELKAAAEELEAAEVKFVVAQDELRAFVEEHGGREIAARADALRGLVLQKEAELDSVRFALADEQATRDYLVAALQGHALGEEGLVQLRSELAEAQAELDELKKQVKPIHPRYREVMKTVSQLETDLLLSAERSTRTVAVKDEWRGDLEHELFGVERSLAVATQRMLHLEETVAKLGTEARRLGILAEQWRDLDTRVGRADAALDHAKAAAVEASQRHRRSQAGPWLTVLAGPTFHGG